MCFSTCSCVPEPACHRALLACSPSAETYYKQASLVVGYAPLSSSFTMILSNKNLMVSVHPYRDRSFNPRKPAHFQKSGKSGNAAEPVGWAQRME